MSAVVCVGSLHHDVMVRAPRRPLAGETLMGERSWTACGGKGGLQAAAAARAGAEVRMAGAVGDDAAGAALLVHLREAGVSAEHVRTVPGAASGMSVAILDAEGEYGAVVVSGANRLVEPGGLEDPALWAGAAVLMLQNEVPDAANLRAAMLAQEAGALVCLNAAPHRPLPDALAARVDLVVVNALEAEALAGLPVASAEDAVAACGRLAARFPRAVVTAGAQGAAVAEGGAALHVPAEPVAVVSTHGAGDAFVGTLCAGLASGVALPEAARAATRAAARVVAS